MAALMICAPLELKAVMDGENIGDSETPAVIVARICGCSEKVKKVTYSIVETYHGLCLDRKDILLAQLEACEKLLKYTSDGNDIAATQNEITELKIALNLFSL